MVHFSDKSEPAATLWMTMSGAKVPELVSSLVDGRLLRRVPTLEITAKQLTMFW